MIVILASCTKETDNSEPSKPVVKYGSLYGNVKLLDKYEVENLDFDNLKIELIDSLNAHRYVEVDSAGAFHLDSIPYGYISLIIDKPGFGIVDTLGFDLQNSVDTLSKIILAEHLPLCYNSFSVSYDNNWIHYFMTTTYQTNDSYMVGKLICYGKSPNVSLNNCELCSGTGSFTNVSMINSVLGCTMSYSLKNFTDNGFQIGDRIYAVCYPIIAGEFTIYDDPKQNFDIISYNIGNPSNISSFILLE
ncbi:MAG: hypothetical protein ACOYN4_18125 [Bacteroidales bacterium]